MRDSYVRALAILIAGGLFLFCLSAAQPYQSDEVWSLRTVSMPFPQMMDEIQADIHPPLYYWLLKPWTMAFGASESAVRGLSILLCIGAALAVYAAGREWFGPRGGLLAAVLFVASPLAGIASQMARMYALLSLASAISMLAFLRLHRREEVSRSDWALYVAANVIGSFTHVWFFFLLFGQGVAHLVFARGRKLPRMIAAAVASLAPYAVLWLPTLLRQVGKTESALAWAPRPGATDLLETVMFLGGLFVFAAPFLWSWWRQRPAHELSWALPATVAAITVLTPFAISFWKPIFWPRFTVVALPAFALAVAAFVPLPAGRRKQAYALETGLIAASCALALILTAYRSACDARSAAEYLARNTQPGDTVVFTNLSRLPIDYYWDRLQPERSVIERSFPAAIDEHPGFVGDVDSPAAVAQLEQEAAVLTAELAGREQGRVFYLHGFRPETDARLKNRLDTKLPLVKSLGLECEAMGSYFQYVSAYACGADPDVSAARH